MRFQFAAFVVACLCMIPLPRAAQAAACDGFVDVDGSSATYCAAVTFMKDRGITLGCDATHFCPNDYITRLQMGLFMKRLGGVLAPKAFQTVHSYSGFTLIGNSTIIFCQIDIPAAAYPRIAEISGTYYGSASSPFVDMSLRGFATGDPSFGFTPFLQYLPVSEAATITQTGSYPLEASKAYSFWINLRNDQSPDATLAVSNCQMRALVFNDDA